MKKILVGLATISLLLGACGQSDDIPVPGDPDFIGPIQEDSDN